jgi:hypothetical protein
MSGKLERIRQRVCPQSVAKALVWLGVPPKTVLPVDGRPERLWKQHSPAGRERLYRLAVARYRAKARLLHPDAVGGAGEEMKRLNATWAMVERAFSKYRPDEHLCTPGAIAAKCGLSRECVSRCLNGVAVNVSPETRTKVIEVALILGYNPAELRRRLRRERLCG